jgi:hypothetical protein
MPEEPAVKMTSGASASRVFANRLGIARALANIDPYVAAVGPAQLLHSLEERRDPVRYLGIVRGGAAHEHTDPPHAVGLLRARRQRPRYRRAAKRDNEFSPSDVGCHATLP